MSDVKLSIFILVFACVDVAIEVFNYKDAKEQLQTFLLEKQRRSYFFYAPLQVFLRYGVVSLCGLWLLGRLSVFWRVALPYNGDDWRFDWVGNLAIALIFIAVFIFLFYRNIRRAKAGDPWALNLLNQRLQRMAPGSMQSLVLPRDTSERRASLFLALSSGTSEELFFRALLPLAAFSIINHYFGVGAISNLYFLIAMIFLVALSALPYLRRRKRAIISTLIINSISMVFFLWSGCILFPIVFHVGRIINSSYVFSRMMKEAEPYRVQLSEGNVQDS